MEHFLLTRFDVRIPGWGDPNLEWRMHRITLFRKYCLPSVRLQSNKNFRWLVFFDAHNKDINGPIIEEASDCIQGFTPVLLADDFKIDGLISFLRQRRALGRALLTTRLDNDDALCPDFVDLVQGAARAHLNSRDKLAINCCNGWVLQDHDLRSSRQDSNPFISMLETDSEIISAWACAHLEIEKRFNILQIEDDPAWLQVIHGRNKVNIIQGKVIDRSNLSIAFPWLTEEEQI